MIAIDLDHEWGAGAPPRTCGHAHNQLEAERAFGAGFMQDKRDQAQQAREGRAIPRAQA
jgi:hypothetical protein